MWYFTYWVLSIKIQIFRFSHTTDRISCTGPFPRSQVLPSTSIAIADNRTAASPTIAKTLTFRGHLLVWTVYFMLHIVLLVKCYVWSMALYGAETWTLRATDQKRLKSFEMRCWRRMEKISWTNHVRNEEVLLTVNEQRNILHEIRKRKANWIGHILRRNCLLQQVIEGKIKGQIEVTRRRGRRRKKLMDDLKDRRGYCQLKEEALDRTMWRNRFGRVFGPVVWQITEDECIYIYMMWNRSRIILHKVRNVLWSFLVSINKYTILLRVLRVLKFKLSNKTKPTQGMFQSTCLRKW